MLPHLKHVLLALKMAKLKTVLVIGASGYIAKHIVQQLLDAGWKMRGSVRSKDKADQIRATMQRRMTF